MPHPRARRKAKYVCGAQFSLPPPSWWARGPVQQPAPVDMIELKARLVFNESRPRVVDLIKWVCDAAGVVHLANHPADAKVTKLPSAASRALRRLDQEVSPPAPL